MIKQKTTTASIAITSITNIINSVESYDDALFKCHYYYHFACYYIVLSMIVPTHTQTECHSTSTTSIGWCQVRISSINPPNQSLNVSNTSRTEYTIVQRNLVATQRVSVNNHTDDDTKVVNAKKKYFYSIYLFFLLFMTLMHFVAVL